MVDCFEDEGLTLFSEDNYDSERELGLVSLSEADVELLPVPLSEDDLELTCTGSCAFLVTCFTAFQSLRLSNQESLKLFEGTRVPASVAFEAEAARGF